MSEKRFVYEEEHFPLALRQIRDTISNKTYDLEDITNVLNEQQNTIEEQNKEIEESSAFIIEQRKENKRLNEENEQLKKEKEQLLRDLFETQGSYVRLVCFVKRLELSEDDLARFEEEIGGELNE